MTAEPFLYHIESVATPGECWEIVRGRKPTEYEDDPAFIITPLYATAPTAGSGWVMVPSEPTVDMIKACDDLDAEMRGQGFRAAPGEAVWSAMITAAPTVGDE